MNNKPAVMAAIFRAMDEINQQLPPEKKLVKDEAALIDPKNLDSLNMVNFLIGIEEQLQLDCGLEIDLAAALSPTAEVPFKSVAELADHILQNARSADTL